MSKNADNKCNCEWRQRVELADALVQAMSPTDRLFAVMLRRGYVLRGRA